MRYPRVQLGTFILICVTGCASPIPASNDFDESAKRFDPDAGKSFVYVVRRGSFIGNAYGMAVALDGARIATIQGKTFILLELLPNNYTFTVNSMQYGTSTWLAVSVELETLPGRSYFVTAKFKGASIGVEVVQGDEGEKLVRKYERVASSLDTK